MNSFTPQSVSGRVPAGPALNRHGPRALAGVLLAVLAAAGPACRPGDSPEAMGRATPVDRPPRLDPDYSGVVIPPNIAPLNFTILEEAGRYGVVLRGAKGAPIRIRPRGASVVIPESSWRTLLQMNRGGIVEIDVYAEADKGGWRRFRAVTQTVASEPIDPFLVYRKIYPVHNSWSAMGLYERRLDRFDERPLLERECCHCHSLGSPDASRFSVDIRSAQHGNSLLLVRDGQTTKLEGTVGFCAWHPGGHLLAASFNQPRLLLHSQKNDMRDIVEFAAWLGSLAVESNVVRRIPTLADDTHLRTCPAWSPDGRHLYFCSAPRRFKDFAGMFRDDYRQVQYDLMRVAYDAARDQWGPPEMVWSARAIGRSAVQPRISPDGRWLTFCLCAYGCWPTYHPDSDLYAIDLHAPGPAAPRKLEINSGACESWHNWSSNSRWLVFGSKRGNPLFSRPYLAHADDRGVFGKPFVLPQRDPAHYGSLLRTFTIPTFATRPLPVVERDLLRGLASRVGRALVLPDGHEATHPGGHDHNASVQ
ncbi:MAG: PD40 domain-containing protein [Verrucomicrobia bacterium]|nr:PD40 domain-containing protein [Verrucomicrobiota bacterium]